MESYYERRRKSYILKGGLENKKNEGKEKVKEERKEENK